MTNDRVAIVGVGYSTTGRRTGLSSRQLAVQAGKAALEDAGMTPADVDGVTLSWDVAGPEPEGLEPVNSDDAAHMLGIDPLHVSSSGGGIVFAHPAREAIAAVRSGQCHTAIAFRVINQRLSVPDLMSQEAPESELVPDHWTDPQFARPFGQVLPVQWPGALTAQRHMDLYGTTEEQFGTHVINQRHNASLNPEAILRDPMTLDDYFASRYISKPLRLFDCDYPVDSGSAVIFTTEERARDFRQKPVFVDAAAFALSWKPRTAGPESMVFTWNSPGATAEHLWKQTDLRPGDVDTVQFYDGFTIWPMMWLEALGFCGPGESGPLIQSGATRLGGSIPLNTDGGACNMGRRHGANFCIEAVRQLRGQCGDRQVPDAKVALWTNAYYWACLLTAD
ncbi:thiolase family protein [Frankia sp. CNm7]|uniref:Thiolase family protein n=1 Tax=Frankia nepalensis TaxID=1836974 RepID=A0A937RNP0_9ACTN|nr:thiolase family protein [Frankia nepalensis]MBL7499143.1 thiolase family protein [Frankia nepalensis]MBL7511039.1 thiolase family protein [Frankia nepalensis]MBL7520493.1 thiolase family protein [Frankia nepalensis]MBL7632119.1 thiolase family protein [Frankia nepalensis]